MVLDSAPSDDDSILMNDPYKERLLKIEKEIEKCIPAAVTPEWTILTCGDPLRVIAKGQLEKILEPARTLLARGGKRWRPLLMMLCGELLGGGERALPLTPLVEIVHNGSLIIDDIEDNSKERRSGPAIHLEFGLDVAINAGNFMYFLPAWLIERSSLAKREKQKLFSCFFEDMRRLHWGQGLDILWHRNHEYIPKIEEYLQMCRLKTGSLARMAARMGIIAGGGGEELTQAMGKIAEDFGVAFQIIDDIKNLTTGVPGKQRGDDIIEGKKSLPIVFHLAHSPEDRIRLKKIFASADLKSAGAGVEEGVEEVIAMLQGSGSIEEAGITARRMLKEAKKRLSKKFRPSEPLRLILDLAEGLVGV